MVSCSCFWTWNTKTNKTPYVFADAVAVAQMPVMDVNEESGSADICVESGVIEGFETALTISLMANDGKASELHQHCIFATIRLIDYTCILYISPQVLLISF